MTKKSAIIIFRQVGWSTEILLTKNASGDWDLPHNDGHSGNVFHTSKSISRLTGIRFPTTLNYLGQFRTGTGEKIMGYFRDVHGCKMIVPREKSIAKFVSLREALFIIDPIFVPILESFYASYSLEYKRNCA